MRGINMNLLRLLGFLTLIASAFPSHAALIDMGTFVRDDVGNADYLKLSQTIGYSYDQVVDGDALGYMAAGWTLTSQMQLALLDHDHHEAFSLITEELIADVVTNNDMSGGQFGIPVGEVTVDRWLGSGGYVNAAYIGATADNGSYAVSFARAVAPVPVPAAVWLFGSALGLLSWMRRKTA